MTAENSNVRKELIQFLLTKVKERELDPKLVKRYLKELGSTNTNESEPIALIGMSCHFPNAENPDELWDNISTGRQSIGPFPATRLEDFKRIRNVAGPLRRGGFLESIDAFDPEYFNIPPKVALNMDPYHRLLLETFIETIEDAGYHRNQLQGRSVGIYVGNDHTHRLSMSYLPFVTEQDFGTITGSWTGVLASRLSYLLNLQGPAVVLDTGCSSALVALDYAIKAIQQGDCESALVGSTNLFLDPVDFENETQSNEYIVRPFDRDASGTVWSEGVGAVFIKPLSKALADRDHVYGIIRGIAVNNDGKSNGLTAPSARAQQEVLLKAWERAGISPESISYIETHGTGTNLGDPIEIKGLTGAFSKHTNKKQFCAIGSVKSNIGHTVGSAGMASLIKVILSLREKALPPNINFKIPNPFIDFCNSPVYVLDSLAPWESGLAPRRAGISSFSLSGTNCHLVVEEAPPDNRSHTTKRLALFPISGRTVGLLEKTALRHLKHIKRHQNMRLEDLCFTASTGREHHAIRAAVLCREPNDLILALEALLEALSKGEIDVNPLEGEGFSVWLTMEPVAEHRIEENKIDTETAYNGLEATLANFVTQENVSEWSKLAELFVSGADINFEKIYASQEVRRVPLPPQVFDNQRFWDETPRRFKEENSESLQPANQEDVLDAVSLWQKACTAHPSLPVDYKPSSKVEVLMAFIWSEVLGYPIINPQHDFYTLGGDSVNALKIIQILNRAFDLDLPPSSLLGAPNFAEFVRSVCIDFGFTDAVLDSRLDTREQRPSVIEPGAEETSFSLSPAQNRMFLSVSMVPDSVAYNVTGVSRIQKEEDIEEVERRMRYLIDRHDSLRTSFYLENGIPMQRVHSKVNFAIERRVLKCEADETGRMERLQAELKSFVRPFDLDKAPLVRAGYFEFEDGEEYLAIDLHHIITDGTSMGLLFADYKDLSEGRTLAPLGIGYKHAVTRISEHLKGTSMLKKREWWMEQFADGIPVLDLFTDMPRPATRDYRGSRVLYTIPVSLTDKLKVLAKESGTTLFTVLLAAFHNLLARLGAERDIVIGTPVAGRPYLDFQNIVGMFVNTLPIRTKSTQEESFLEFLGQLKTTVMSAFDNQEYPYESLIEDLKPERNPGRNPLFDVYFALQNVDMGLSGSEQEFIEFDSGTAKFDLTVSARETSDGLLIEWEYAETLFYRTTIERMARRFERQLASIIENPSTSLGKLDIMEEGELEFILDEWNQTETRSSYDRGIVALFEEMVSVHGQKSALIMDGQSMSYEELNNRANRIAREVVKRGISPHTGVALLMKRSFDMIAAILGVLKAGCYYIPLDSENSVERLRVMLEDSKARLLLTHQALKLKDREVLLEVIPMLDLGDIDPQSSNENLDIKGSGDDIAYIMYTSGSTGTPKGTIICNKSVIRVVRDAGYIHIYPEDVLLQLSNYSFDGSVFDIFGALLNGASLVLLNKDEVTDPKKLGDIVRDNRVSVFFITTALFNALVDANLDCLQFTRKILFGGEAASVHHVRRAYESLGSERLIHVYGPTETTVFATAYSINEPIKNERIPIGKAIGNTTLYVLDDQMSPQPIGVPGELYIGGNGLAAGYLNQPEHTRDRFVNNPFKSGERLYRSGDLVVLGDDGFLRYFARLDQQVKLRGYRIELGEIEAVAKRVGIVNKVHAGVHVDEGGARNLCLWVVFDGNAGDPECQTLRQELVHILPSYMVPSFVIPISVLPLNKNGKIDKTQLPGPMPDAERQIREPRNEHEELLASVWSQVLGVRKPSIDDNFFTLGGDSIKAIQVIARLQNTGFTVDMEDIFKYQTIEALAPFLKVECLIEAEQNEVQGSCAPSVIQDWFLRKAQGQQQLFTQAMLIRGARLWKRAEIQAVMNRLCQHHDALRMTVESDGRLRLRSLDEGRMFYVIELPSHLNEEDFNAALIEVQKHIDLNGGPLVALAVGESNNVGQLFIAVHHIAVDVVSWGVILEDLIACLENIDTPLPKKTTSFPAWTKALTEWAQEGGARDELPYWRKVAEEATHFLSPFPSVNVLRKDTVKIDYWLDGEIGQALCGEANSAFHTETVHLLLSVLARALCSWFQTTGILINLEGHGREEFAAGLNVSRTVGWFTSTYPVLLKAGAEEIGDDVKSVKETVRGVPRRGFGFGVLHTLDAGLPDQDRALLESLSPSISFNYLGVQDLEDVGNVSIKNLPGEVTIDEEWETNWLLDIVAAQVGSALCLEIRYPRTMFSEEDISGFLSRLGTTADEVVQYCLKKDIGEKTASDFNVTKLQQEELENILDDLIYDS